jgi:hypothetical protein
MLPKQPILVSDEKIVAGDWCIYPNQILSKCPTQPPLGAKKIVAGIPEMPTIDFSDLSEADCKKVGWVDVEKLARNFMAQYPLTERMFSTMLSGNYTNTQNSEGYSLFIKCLTEFHKASQSLNEKKYSEVFDWLEKNDYLSDKRSVMEKEFIQYISQPKVFNVEVEIEEKTTEDIERELGIYGHDEGLNEAEYKDFAAQSPLIKPKITNGAIRIIRVL